MPPESMATKNVESFKATEGSAEEEPRPVLIAVSDGAFDDERSLGSFDPFGIAALSSEAPIVPETPPQVTRVTRSGLPPRLIVRLTLYEEVSAVAKSGSEVEGASDVSIEGSVYAQVQCSDASRNAPFALQMSSAQSFQIGVRPNPRYTKLVRNVPVVTIPKPEIGYVPVAYYSMTTSIAHMPVLLERKVTVHDTSVRVAVQVRSKLTNQADLQDFCIAVAVPEKVDGASVQILRGEGSWDALQRVIRWKLSSLVKGNSFMVSAQASLWNALPEGEEIAFPVLLRCRSTADPISTVDFDVIQPEGAPSSLTSTKAHSFRLLHRLT